MSSGSWRRRFPRETDHPVLQPPQASQATLLCEDRGDRFDLLSVQKEIQLFMIDPHVIDDLSGVLKRIGVTPEYVGMVLSTKDSRPVAEVPRLHMSGMGSGVGIVFELIPDGSRSRPVTVSNQIETLLVGTNGRGTMKWKRIRGSPAR